MKIYRLLGALVLVVSGFAQSDRGTITGTVSDPAGALVPNSPVVAKNVATGVQITTQTTETGNYTIPSVPVGVYSLSVERPGFRNFLQTGIRVQVAQIARLDIVLQVGATTESITVTADAPILKTESAEQSTVVTRERINQLPLSFAGAIRNPLTFIGIAPGTSVGGWNDIRVNGSPGNTFRIIFEGQDTTSALNPRVSDESQPSVDAIEEFTLQSSNFSAEFGQVGGGLVNFTARSGTNNFHGSAYDYMINEAFNAGTPYTDNGQGGHVRTRIRQHDFGGNIGGPVRLPKLYNGKDRTFFFFNYEMYRQIEKRYAGLGTLPSVAYRNGDFTYLLTGRSGGTDSQGRPILEGAIYDPRSTQLVNNQVVRAPFVGNRIPVSQFDPIALKVQNLIPQPDPKYGPDPLNNFEKRFNYRKIQAIPSIKIDHNFNERAKISGYFSKQRTDKDNGQDGLPDPISQRRDQFIYSYTTRINYDHTLRPNLINHVGAGYQRYHNPDTTPLTDYDSVKELGLKGAIAGGFPRITGLLTGLLGPANYNLYLQDKPTVVESITWIRGSHIYKLGGEWRIDTFTNSNKIGGLGQYDFGNAQTALPYLQTTSVSGLSIGYPYASFLLGLANSGSISNPTDPQYRRTAWGLFVNDSWKLRRNLTLDYGLRWDLQPPAHELHYRTTEFDPGLRNPAAGNLPGAARFAGSGPGRCDCNFGNTYPYAIAPRIGLAYQVTPKTVFRVAWGISYGQLTAFNYIGAGNSLGHGFNTIPFTNPSFGDPAVIFQNGLNYDAARLYATNLNPGIRPSPGQLDSPPAHIDANAGRPPRVNNWSIGVQREVTKDLVLEAAYVGNRGVWYRADNLVDYNALRPERIQAAGLDISKVEDRAVLTSRLDSAVAQSRGFRAPYSGYPLSATVAQSLRPFPQFGGIGSMWAPLGSTWYDSLQVKATKRYSRGLDVVASYTWSKSLANVSEQGSNEIPINDVFNRRLQKNLSPYDQPHILVGAFRWELPASGMIERNSVTRALLNGWAVGGIFRYASGFPIRVPDAQNNLSPLLFRSTLASRVPGVPLFTKDLNGGLDPNKDFVFNPRAWADPPPGQFGTSAAYYTDYRYQRRPNEQLSLERMIRVRESMRVAIRFEMFNLFNRIVLPDPERNNALATQRVSSAGVPQSGFGRINAGAVSTSSPRSGQLVVRFSF